jgi:hypothetical protein
MGVFDGKPQMIEKQQNINHISNLLNDVGIKHRCTEKVLEIKLY